MGPDIESDIAEACRRMWETNEPQSIEYMTDWGKVTVTVSASWATGDPRKERADDPPIC